MRTYREWQQPDSFHIWVNFPSEIRTDSLRVVDFPFLPRERHNAHLQAFRTQLVSLLTIATLCQIPGSDIVSCLSTAVNVSREQKTTFRSSSLHYVATTREILKVSATLLITYPRKYE